MVILEEMIYIDNWGRECTVCGRNMSGERGFACIEYDGEMITLCSPLCVEMFHREPLRYIFRNEARKLVHAGKPHATMLN